MDIARENPVFQSVTREEDARLPVIAGKLPEELTGTLYRNGPARWETPGFRAEHVFDGDGMISQFVFDGSGIRFRNRFVRTPKFRAGEKGRPVRGLGTLRDGGIFANAFRTPADRANTHALFHHDSVLALSDDGRPWDIDPDTLDTRGATDFGGKLPKLGLFSPHPRVDPLSGDVYNFGLAPGLPLALNCYRLDRHGKLETIAKLPLDRVHINHDFVITRRYLVFVLAPLVIDPLRAVSALLGKSTYESATRYRPELGNRIALVPRAGGKPRIIEIDAFPYVHFNNAYDDGDDVVIDLVRLDDWDEPAELLRDFRRLGVGNSVGGVLHRLRVHRDNRVHRETLCADKGEFPQHDWRRTSLPYQYGYYVADVDNRPCIVKVDTSDGCARYFPFEEGDVPGEPLFVPRCDTAAEDDGWLLSVVYQRKEHGNALYVLDARRPDEQPVAVARLPQHQFPGFHGSFTRRIAR